MGNRRTALVAKVMIVIGFSIALNCRADITVRTKRSISGSGLPSNIEASMSIELEYVRGKDRRKETQSPGGAKIAIIRNCDKGYGFFVDFDRKQYYRFRLPGDARSTNGVGEPSSPQSQTLNQQQIKVIGNTIKIGKPKIFFGHTATHFVTTLKQLTSDGIVVRELVIDGWYAADIVLPNLNCGAKATNATTWASALAQDNGNIVLEHTGPTPPGLAVKLKTTTRTMSKDSQGIAKETIMNVEREILDISEKPLDRGLFEVPKDFKALSHIPGTGEELR